MRPFALQVVWLVRALRVGLQNPALKMQTLSDAVQDTDALRGAQSMTEGAKKVLVLVRLNTQLKTEAG